MRILIASFLCLLSAGSVLAQTRPTPVFGPGTAIDGGNFTNSTSTTPFSFLNASPTLDTRFSSGGLTNGNIISAGGNQIAYCPPLSCLTTPTSGHQLTSALFWSTTHADGSAEEQTVAVETIIGTGLIKTWANNTAFAVGDNVEFQDARNAVYRATVAGTSAATGTGPTGTGSSIIDGTVHWTWINAAAINGKVGIYNETKVIPGAGNAWSQANNFHLLAGVHPAFMINTELDYQNDAADCSPTAGGVGNCITLEMSMLGTHVSTAGIHISSPNTANYATAWGLRFNGDKLASVATIEDDTASPIGIAFNYSTSGAQSHSIGSIVDEGSGGGPALIMGGTKASSDIWDLTNTPSGILNTGVHSNGFINDSGNSPISINLSGTHSVATISDASTANAGINLAGTYSLTAIATISSNAAQALITKDGQKVCFNNTDACFVHSATLGKLYYQVGGVNLWSIADTTGNVIFKGTVTPSSTP